MWQTKSFVMLCITSTGVLQTWAIIQLNKLCASTNMSNRCFRGIFLIYITIQIIIWDKHYIIHKWENYSIFPTISSHKFCGTLIILTAYYNTSHLLTIFRISSYWQNVKVFMRKLTNIHSGLDLVTFRLWYVSLFTFSSCNLGFVHYQIMFLNLQWMQGEDMCIMEYRTMKIIYCSKLLK